MHRILEQLPMVQTTASRRMISSASLIVASAFAMTGCGSASMADSDVPDMGSAHAYWALTLQDHAINLSVAAPTNTIQLIAVPRDVTGTPIVTNMSAPTFRVLDADRLTVDSTGLLTAYGVGSGLKVIAKWQIQGVTHTDTAYVRVTSTAPAAPLATFTIDPLPGDSAKWSFSIQRELLYGQKRIVPRATDLDGGAIPVETVDGDGLPIEGLAVAYTSSNAIAAGIDVHTGAFGAGAEPDTTTFTASTYAYGVRKADTLAYTIGYPTSGTFDLSATRSNGVRVFTPSVLEVGIGAVVTWTTSYDEPMGIFFDDPSVAVAPFFFPDGDAGNIPAIDPNGYFFRQFNIPGTYPFHDAEGHVTGTIVVKAD